MSAGKVFDLEELREAILNYAVFKNDGSDLSVTNVRSYRLVQKAWLQSTSRCVQKAEKSLLHFNLPESSTFGKTNNPENQQLPNTSLNKFINDIAAPGRTNVFPPFSIKASEDFFRKENYPLFLNYLTNCGSSLIALKLSIPKDGGSMHFIFPRLYLKRLVRLKISLTDNLLNTPGMEDGNMHVVPFIQSLFNDSDNLKTFKMGFTSDLIPASFQHLILPQTLTRICLSCRIESQNLNVLIKNPLPNLSHLDLLIPEFPWEEGMVFKILQNLKATLKYLTFDGIVHDGQLIQPNMLSFPLMKNLKCFSNNSMHIQLDPMTTSLQDNLPNITCLKMDAETPEGFKRWTERSVFKSVKNIRLFLVDVKNAENEDGYWIGTGVEHMQLLRSAFPNVRELTLTLIGTQVDGLKYLFLEIPQLTYLRLFVERTDEIFNASCWDSALIGIPVEFAAALQSNRDFWKCVDLKTEEFPAITNLKCLRKLVLETTKAAHLPSASKDKSLISDLAFHFSFLKMPQLETLNFVGRFMASDEVILEWKKLGRKYNYKPVDDPES